MFNLDATTLSKNYSEDADVYVTYIDKEAESTTEIQSLIYPGFDIPITGAVIDPGSSGDNEATQLFPISGNFTSGGFSVNVNRTPDA